MIWYVPIPYLSMANIIAHFIDTANGFNIDAQVVGHIEEGKRSLTIKSEFGEFNY